MAKQQENTQQPRAAPKRKPSGEQKVGDAITGDTADTAATKATLSPHLVCAGAAEAIEFYKRAFGAKELLRIPGDEGKLIHAAIEINAAMVMLTDEAPQWGALSPKILKGTPVTLHLNVADVDAFVQRAVDAGAKVIMPVADMFWGDRYGILEDPFGHHWSIATHQKDMSEAELRAAAKQAMASAPGA